jgi:hypothetical protein
MNNLEPNDQIDDRDKGGIEMLRKSLVLILVFVIFNLVPASAQEQTQPYCKVKNAVITYEYYGIEKGSIKLMIKDFGQFVRREDNCIKTIDGGEKEYKFFYLLTPEFLYQADLHESNMAVRMARPADLAGLRLLLHEITYGEDAASFETDDRYQKEKDDIVAGQPCKVYHDKTSDVTFWVWNDIILKTSAPDIEMLDKEPWIRKKDPYGKIAVKVDLDPKFEKDTFEVPEGIEIIGDK